MGFFSKSFVIYSSLAPGQLHNKLETIIAPKRLLAFPEQNKIYEGALEKTKFRVRKIPNIFSRINCPPIVEGEIREENARTILEIHLKLGMENFLGFLMGIIVLIMTVLFALTIGKEFPLFMVVISGMGLLFLVLNLFSFKFQMAKEKSFFEKNFSEVLFAKSGNPKIFASPPGLLGKARCRIRS